MSIEVELKFSINQPSITPLSQFFSAQPNLIAQHSLQLSNTYYDTPDNLLSKNRSSIRIRGTEQVNQAPQYEITVKSAGRVVAGLHQRSEFNAPLSNAKLDLTVLPDNILPESIDRQQLAADLVAQFTTHFHRQTWLIHYKQSQIEIALDQGEIACLNMTSPQTMPPRTMPIQEVELELKSGKEEDLLLFALELAPFNIHLFSQSKAARGYRLLNNTPLKPNDDSASATTDLSSLLQYWQSNEEFALENPQQPSYQATLQHVQQVLDSLIEQNTLPQTLQQTYLAWKQAATTISDITSFAFSEPNTTLKLKLMHYVMQEQTC